MRTILQAPMKLTTLCLLKLIANNINNISKVKIFNLLGELVNESNYTTPLLEVTLNLEGLAKGLYLLQLVDGSQFVETKIILFQ